MLYALPTLTYPIHPLYILKEIDENVPLLCILSQVSSVVQWLLCDACFIDIQNRANLSPFSGVACIILILQELPRHTPARIFPDIYDRMLFELARHLTHKLKRF